MDITIDCALRFPATLAPELEEAVRVACRYKNPDFARNVRLGYSTYKTPRYIDLTTRDGRGRLCIPRGMTRVVRDVAGAAGERVSWIDNRTSVPIDLIPFRGDPREYQRQIVEAGRRFQNLLVRSPAASGKTVAGLLAVAELGERALAVTWSVPLAQQWAEECERFLGFVPDMIGGGTTRQRGAPLTVAVQQSLHNRIPENRDRYGLLICDEVQRFAARTLFEDVVRFSAKYRIGFSEDEKRKDKKQFLIYAQFGKVRAEVDREQLVREGRVMPVHLRVVETGWAMRDEHGEPIPSAALDHSTIVAAMVNDDDRNRLVLEHLLGPGPRMLIDPDVLNSQFVPRTALILTQRVAHCVTFKQMLYQAGVPCGLLLGGRERREEFMRTRDALNAGTLHTAAGTSAVYQGFDVPRLETGFIVTPSATNQQLLGQQIGRFARPYDGKRTPVVFYFLDGLMFPYHRHHLRRFAREDASRFASTVYVDEDGQEREL